MNKIRLLRMAAVAMPRTLIYTCELSDANPFDYLTQLQRHADEAAAQPNLWMPWNYRQTLGATQAAA